MNSKQNTNSCHLDASNSMKESMLERKKNHPPSYCFSEKKMKKKEKRKWMVSSSSSSLFFILLLLAIMIHQRAATAATIVSQIIVSSWYDAGGRSVALAVSGGIPIIVFYHDVNKKLNYIRCNDSTCSTSQLTVIDGGGSTDYGSEVSIAITSGSGFAILGYRDFARKYVAYISCNDILCTTFDRIFDAVDAMFTSVALSGTVRVVSFYDPITSTFRAASGANLVAIIDSTIGAGMWSSMKVRSNGLPVISYYDYTTTSLKLVLCGTVGCTSNNVIKNLAIASNPAGMYTSLVLDPSERAIIAHSSALASVLWLTRCNDAACSTWTANVVDNYNPAAGYWASLTLKRDLNPLISYISDSSGILRVANCQNPACSSRIILTPDGGSTWSRLTTMAMGSGTSFVVAYVQGTTLKVLSDTYPIVCPANSVWTNSLYDASGWAICQCNSGFTSTSGNRLAELVSLETCSAVTCPTNSVFNNTYDNGGNGYPICQCAVGYKSTSGDRLASLSLSETCITACPLNSIIFGYDASEYPICQCNSGFKSTSGDRLAYQLSSETCTTACPSNSVFLNYDINNYPVCQCNPGFKSPSGDRLASLFTSETACSAVTCPTASTFSNYVNTNGYPYCQCNAGYSGLTGVVTSSGPTYVNETGSCQWVCPTNSEIVTVDTSPACQCSQGYVESVTLKQPVSQAGICSTYGCPTNSVLSYSNTDGSPICTCNTNYVANTTGLQTVDQGTSCILDCPLKSQYNATAGYCECDKGYRGDLSESSREVTPVTGTCTSICGYKGAVCATTDNCCKPGNKLICQNSQCTVCRKLGSICTRNKQCCSGRCNKKASICREPKP